MRGDRGGDEEGEMSARDEIRGDESPNAAGEGSQGMCGCKASLWKLRGTERRSNVVKSCK